MGPPRSSANEPVQRPKRYRTARAREIALFVSGAIGSNFFRALVQHLGESCGASCALVGEIERLFPDRVRTVAVWLHGRLASAFEYDLTGSFCASVQQGRTASMATGVRWEYPADPVLARARAEAAIAVPLISSERELIGVILLAFATAQENLSLIQEVVEMFAGRASSELEHTRIEERLRESEQRYQAFIAEAIDGMWRIEFDPPIPTHLPEDEQIERMWRSGYVAELNDAMARLLGYASGDEVVGSPFESVVRGAEDLRREIRAAIRGGYKSTGVEVRRIDVSGALGYRLRSSWGIVDRGELRRIWGTTRDITGLRLSELRLEVAERQYRYLLESLPLPVVMLDINGDIVFCNDALCQVTGWSQGELIGRNWFHHAIPPTELEGATRAFQAALGGSVRYYENEVGMCTRDGLRRLMSWVNVIMRDAEGKTSGATLVGTDITESHART